MKKGGLSLFLFKRSTAQKNVLGLARFRVFVPKMYEIGNNNFHIEPLRKGGVHKTKIVCYTEEHYRKVQNYLKEHKSSKGLQVVITDIDSSVESREVKEALEQLGYNIKNVNTIFNKNKQPLTMFRVELEPDARN